MGREIKDRGDANLLGLVLALPVLLLLFAIAFDWLREPLARQALRYALYHGVYHVVPNYDCGSGTPTRPESPVCLTQSGYDSTPIPNFTLDSSTPAGYSFCEASGLLWGGAIGGVVAPLSEAGCFAHLPNMFSDSSYAQAQTFGVRGFSALGNGAHFVRKIAVLALNYLTMDGSGLFKYDQSDVGIQINLAWVPGIDSATGLADPNINQDSNEFRFFRYVWPNQVDDEFQIPLWGSASLGNPSDLLFKLVAQSVDPSNQYRLGWGVEPCLPGGAGADICSGRYFQSTWVIAVGYIKLHSLFGKWSLFGSSTDDPQANIISEYVFRPLNTYASLEVVG